MAFPRDAVLKLHREACQRASGCGCVTCGQQYLQSMNMLECVRNICGATSSIIGLLLALALEPATCSPHPACLPFHLKLTQSDCYRGAACPWSKTNRGICVVRSLLATSYVRTSRAFLRGHGQCQKCEHRRCPLVAETFPCSVTAFSSP